MQQRPLIITLINILLNLLFIAAGALCSGFLAIRGTDSQMIINILSALVIYGVLAFYYQAPARIFLLQPIRLTYLLPALLLSGTAVSPINQAFQQRLPHLANQLAYMVNWRLHSELLTAQSINLLFQLLVGLALFIFFYWLLQSFWPHIKGFFLHLDKVEKTYLLIVTVLFAAVIFYVFNLTNVFYSPQANGQIIYYDVIYTSDTGIHLATDVYQNLNAPENDIRQPLFGLFALPLATTAKLAADLMSNLTTNIPTNPASAMASNIIAKTAAGTMYPILCNLLQIILLATAAIFLARLMELDGWTKALFLGILSISYPFWLFALNMEQYIFAVFWLIAFIYVSLHNANAEVTSTALVHDTAAMYGNAAGHSAIDLPPLLYIGATGSLLTSGILFPLLCLPSKQQQKQLLRQRQQQQRLQLGKLLKPLLKGAVQFFAITIIAGQLPLFMTALAKIKSLLRFAGTSLDFATKLKQYLSFISSCIIAPQAGADFSTFKHVSYQLAPITKPNWLGLIILLLALLGFVLNRHKPFAKLCLSWVAFSFLLLVPVGWGTLENGQILYSLYFSWAFICLAFLAIISLPRNMLASRHTPASLSPIALAILAFIILAMGIINSRGILELIQFGITYYPIVP